jgi:hypothetical protein
VTSIRFSTRVREHPLLRSFVEQRNRALWWEHNYSTVRPRQALGYRSPLEFLERWKSPSRKAECHQSCARVQSFASGDQHRYLTWIPEGIDAEDFYTRHLLGEKQCIDPEYLEKRTAWSDCRIIPDTILLIVRRLTYLRRTDKREVLV